MATMLCLAKSDLIFLFVFSFSFSSENLAKSASETSTKYREVAILLDFLKVRFGIRTFPACFARFLPTYIVVGGWPWCDWGCVIILANEKRIFK